MEAAEFLATQGDVWDTQWDMFLDLVGAVAAQLLFARRQDRELSELAPALSVAAPTGRLPIDSASHQGSPGP